MSLCTLTGRARHADPHAGTGAELQERPAANPPSESNTQLLENIVKMMLNLAAMVPISHAGWVLSINKAPSCPSWLYQYSHAEPKRVWTIPGCRSRTNGCAAFLIGNCTGNEGEGKSRRIYRAALPSLLPADTRTPPVQHKAAGNVLNWALILIVSFCSFRSQFYLSVCDSKYSLSKHYY